MTNPTSDHFSFHRLRFDHFFSTTVQHFNTFWKLLTALSLKRERERGVDGTKSGARLRISLGKHPNLYLRCTTIKRWLACALHMLHTFQCIPNMMHTFPWIPNIMHTFPCYAKIITKLMVKYGHNGNAINVPLKLKTKSRIIPTFKCHSKFLFPPLHLLYRLNRPKFGKITFNY